MHIKAILSLLALFTTLSLAACGGGGGGGSAVGGGGGGTDNGGGNGGPGDGGDGGTTQPVTNLAIETKTLPSITTGSFGAAVDVNDAGVAVGLSGNGADFRATRWNIADAAPTPTELSALPGGTDSAAYAVNSSGIAVGESTDAAGATVAVFWPAGSSAPTELDTTGLPAGATRALSINDLGEVVGEATGSDGNTAAVYWSSTTATPVQLGNLAVLASAYSTAYFISETGSIAGESLNASGQAQAVVWVPSGGSFTGGESPTALSETQSQLSSAALAIDLDGRVVGEIRLTSGTTQGALWGANGALVTLLPEGSTAQFINGDDRIVGATGADTNETATIWNGSDPSDQQSLQLAAPAQAFGVNDSSQFVGSADGTAFAALPQ